jgi:hypothetical protein
MRLRRPDAAHRRGAADGLDLDVRQRVRGGQARDDRDARPAAANAWTATLSPVVRATRGPDPAARQVCRTMRNQALAGPPPTRVSSASPAREIS